MPSTRPKRNKTNQVQGAVLKNTRKSHYSRRNNLKRRAILSSNYDNVAVTKANKIKKDPSRSEATGKYSVFKGNGSKAKPRREV